MALDHILVLACVIGLVLLCILILLFLLYILLRRIFPSERFTKLENEEVTERILLDKGHAYGNSSPGFFFKPTILIQENEKRTGHGDNTEIKMPESDLTLSSKENCERFPPDAASENKNPETLLNYENKEMVLKLHHKDIVKNDYSVEENKIIKCVDNNASNTTCRSSESDEKPIKASYQDNNDSVRQCFVFNSSRSPRTEATNLSMSEDDLISRTSNFVPNSNYQKTIAHQKANNCFLIGQENDSAVEANLVNNSKNEMDEKTSGGSSDTCKSNKEDVGKKFSEVARDSNFSSNPPLLQSIVIGCAKTMSYDSHENSLSPVPNHPEEVEVVPKCHGKNADMETNEEVDTSPSLENSSEKAICHDSVSDSISSDSNFVSNLSLLQSIINVCEKTESYDSHDNSVSVVPNHPEEVQVVANCLGKNADMEANEEVGTSLSLGNRCQKAMCHDSVNDSISNDSNFVFNPSLLQSIINSCEKAMSYDSHGKPISSVPNSPKEVVPNWHGENAVIEANEEVGTSPSLSQDNSCGKAMDHDSGDNSISSDTNFGSNPPLFQSILNGCSKDMSYDSHDDSVSSIPNWPKEAVSNCQGKNADVEATSENFVTNSLLFQENGYAKAMSPDFDSKSVSKLVTWPLSYCASKKEFAVRNNKHVRIKSLRKLSDSRLVRSTSNCDKQPVTWPSLHFLKTEEEASCESWKPPSVVKESVPHYSPSFSM